MVLPERKCPACGAGLTPGIVDCEYCGSRVVPLALSFREREDVQRLAKRLDAYLAGEQQRIQRSLNLFCTAGWVVGVALLVLCWLYFELRFTGWVLLLSYSLLWLFLCQTMRRYVLPRRLIRFYRSEVEPQISRYIDEKTIPRWQFDQMVCYALDEDAPLQRFLSSSA